MENDAGDQRQSTAAHKRRKLSLSALGTGWTSVDLSHSRRAAGAKSKLDGLLEFEEIDAAQFFKGGKSGKGPKVITLAGVRFAAPSCMYLNSRRTFN